MRPDPGGGLRTIRFLTGAGSATRRVHTDRQQWMADFHHVPAIQAQLRSEPDGGAEGGGVRVRFRPVDDQAAWLRREIRVLGLQSGVLHPDGRSGRGDRADQAVCHLCGADHAASADSAHGGDDRQHRQGAVRDQHRIRLAAPRIRTDGNLAGIRALSSALRVLHRIRDHHTRAMGHRAVRLQGRFLPDGRLPVPAAADRQDLHHLRGPERRRHPLCRATCRL